MLGHDWAPEGFEQWSNDAGAWEVFPETNPQWHWTYGFEHRSFTSSQAARR